MESLSEQSGIESQESLTNDGDCNDKCDYNRAGDDSDSSERKSHLLREN